MRYYRTERLYLPTLHININTARMRFTLAALAMAGSAVAQSGAVTATDYRTRLVTLTECPPTVTDCPAESKTVKTLSSVFPVTTSTIYSTKVHTITDCASVVTDCPAHSTVYSTEFIAVSTTVCPISTTAVPSRFANTTMPVASSASCVDNICPSASRQPILPESVSCVDEDCVVEKTKTVAVIKPVQTDLVCSTVTPVTRTYTTVITTVEQKTIDIPCETGSMIPIVTSNPVSPPKSNYT